MLRNYQPLFFRSVILVITMRVSVKPCRYKSSHGSFMNMHCLI